METSVQYIWSDLREELQKFILSKIADPSQAEDILQEVFIKVHLRIHQLKDPAKLTSWVYQICRHTIIDNFHQNRQAPRYRDLLFPDQYEEEEPVYTALSRCINGKIAGLSPTDRDAVLLTYFQDYTQKQLAEFLGLSYSGTKNRVQRAREKLRREILACEHVISDSRGKPIRVNK